MSERADAYARADAQVDTSDLTSDDVATLVLEAFSVHAARRCVPPA
jgi:hypothetical protein